MSHRLGLVAVAVAAGAVTSIASQQARAPQRPVFRSQVQTVAVYATVNDREGRLVPDLTRDDFLVLDNGKPANLVVFSNEIQVITVAVLLDMSTSMIRRLLRVREASMAFVNALLPDDRVRVGTFGDEVAISPHLTNNKALLTRVLEEELWPGGFTPLWRAVDAGMTSLAGERGRRVVLTVTDGQDSTDSGPSYDDVRRRAIAERFMVYAVGFGSGGLGSMTHLAEETGGGHVLVGDSDNLQAALARVADELRHQYLLGFTPTALDGRVHKLEVKMARSGMKARVPKNYLAVPDK